MSKRKGILFFLLPLLVHFYLFCFVPAYSLCFLYQYTNILCPSCKMTRGLVMLLTGHFREGLNFNPFLAPVLLFLFFAFIVSLFKLRVPHWIQYALFFLVLVPFFVTWGGKIFILF